MQGDIRMVLEDDEEDEDDDEQEEGDAAAKKKKRRGKKSRELWDPWHNEGGESTLTFDDDSHSDPPLPSHYYPYHPRPQP